jgi:SAM-dependent methyltransferase
MDDNTISEVYLKRKSYHSLDLNDTDIQLKYILKYIPEDLSAPILDAGCGNGKRALKLHHLKYTNISAVDLFDSIPVKEINYQKAGIENLPFDNSSFEFIYSMSVIYYPKDTEKAIREFSRVLKPGGILLMTAHTKYSLFTLRRVVMRSLGRKNMKHLEDVRFKSAKEYVRWLKRNDFEVILVDGFNLSFILAPAYHFLRKLFLKYLSVALPAISASVTRNRFVARVKSVIAYHMVIVARKTSIAQDKH